MSNLIAPFITIDQYRPHACDRFMAFMGGWADIGENLRWPYSSIPAGLAPSVREKALHIMIFLQ